MSQLIISVSGVRGIVGNGLDAGVVGRLAGAYATKLPEAGRVVLARDGRAGGEELAESVAGVLVRMGNEVVDLGIVSTPGAALMATKLGASGAVVITASHNPVEWNGLKFLSSDGQGLDAGRMGEIRQMFYDGSFSYGEGGQEGTARRDDTTHEVHTGEVLRWADVEAVRGKRFKVVLDSINGAGGQGGKLLLEKLDCQLVHVNAQAGQKFAHRPEPIAENLGGLCEEVERQKADVGFAQDPDADRLAIVDEMGRFIGEEYTLAFAAWAVLARERGTVATNLSTSRMVDDVAGRFGVEVYRTPIGEANVVAGMREHDCVIGGEGNGGVIDPKVVSVRDSFSGMSLVLGLMAEKGMTVSQLVAEIPRYCMVKTKFDCGPGRAEKILEAVAEVFADQKLNREDGVRIDWPEGWAHIRSSNTEPIMRIMAEASEEGVSRELTGRVKKVAEKTE